MDVTFKFAIGDRVIIGSRAGSRGKVRGLFVGEDKRHQVSVAYVDGDGDPVGPEWFYENDLAAA